MRTSSILPIATCFLVLVAAGCRPADETVPNTERVPTESATKATPNARSSIAELTERDAEIIRHVLRQHDDAPGDRIYFLTTTPMDEWGENGDWMDLPRSFRDSITSLTVKYRPANEAYLKDGRVLEKGTDNEAWMRWITVKRWISDSEVEVEDGVWCCPLGGGASTVTYERIEGQWSIKSVGPSWVS